MKHICYILVFSVFTACNSNRKSTDISEKTDVEGVFVTYYCGMIDTHKAIRCERLAEIQAIHPANDYSLLSEGIISLIDTFIVDKPILKEIESLLTKREPAEDYNEDARMYVSINYLDGTAEGICLGMNTPQVMFNGKPMFIDNKLIYLLRLNSGYYRWFDNDELELFKEYKDYHE